MFSSFTSPRVFPWLFGCDVPDLLQSSTIPFFREAPGSVARLRPNPKAAGSAASGDLAAGGQGRAVAGHGTAQDVAAVAQVDTPCRSGPPGGGGFGRSAFAALLKERLDWGSRIERIRKDGFCGFWGGWDESVRMSEKC